MTDLDQTAVWTIYRDETRCIEGKTVRKILFDRYIGYLRSSQRQTQVDLLEPGLRSRSHYGRRYTCQHLPGLGW